MQVELIDLAGSRVQLHFGNQSSFEEFWILDSGFATEVLWHPKAKS